ncbi:MAG TPA: sensor histidine kinase [Thermoanaerobaculia bacterium]|nr:sensor histidine kinase [Thermoanaerobaculia bacterium]
MRLLPEDKNLGWTPYAWLVYLSSLLFFLWFGHGSPSQIAATAAAVLVFLVVYFRAFWLAGKAVLGPVAVMVLLGVLLAPWNAGASSFFIFAASFCGRITPQKLAVRSMLAVVAVIVLIAWFFGLRPEFWAVAVLFSLLIGGVNMHHAEVGRANARLLLSQGEVERLAKIAERERIARDLHDLLGHTLSTITLKSELAARLVERDPARAGLEMREVERISREALREVRSAVSGYRSEGLSAELARARLALDASGLAFEYFVSPVELDPIQETALALAVREAVTNLVRHAGARTCTVRLEQDAESTRLEVADDGRGGSAAEGNGLRAMRERIEGLGGTLEHHRDEGTRIVVTLPRRRAGPVAETVPSDASGLVPLPEAGS